MKLARPTIIILHGWGLTGVRFAPLARVLRSYGYRVFTPDLPGFGDSVMPTRPYSLSDYVHFLEDYISEKKLRSVILIGHSFGGRVTLKYCGEHRPNLRGIILTGTPGFTPVPRKRLFIFIFLAKIGKLFFSLWPLSLLQEKIRLKYYYLVGAREFYRAQGVMRETFKRVVQEELSPLMKHVQSPCLLAWGALDRITPVWIAEKMHKEIHGSDLLIIPDNDHGVPYKNPERFASSIKKFIENL